MNQPAQSQSTTPPSPRAVSAPRARTCALPQDPSPKATPPAATPTPTPPRTRGATAASPNARCRGTARKTNSDMDYDSEQRYCAIAVTADRRDAPDRRGAPDNSAIAQRRVQ